MVVLQILVAVLLLVFGIEFLTSYNSTGNEIMRSVSKAFGGNNNVVPVIFAVIEIVVGALLILEFFMPVATRFVFFAMIVICVMWIISIVMAFFANNLLEPNFFSWMKSLSIELILLITFWLVGSSKR